MSKDTRKFWVFMTCLGMWSLNMATLLVVKEGAPRTAIGDNLFAVQVLVWTVAVIYMGTAWARHIDDYGS